MENVPTTSAIEIEMAHLKKGENLQNKILSIKCKIPNYTNDNGKMHLGNNQNATEAYTHKKREMSQIFFLFGKARLAFLLFV